jgi:hypothetical protein
MMPQLLAMVHPNRQGRWLGDRVEADVRNDEKFRKKVAVLLE